MNNGGHRDENPKFDGTKCLDDESSKVRGGLLGILGQVAKVLLA